MNRSMIPYRLPGETLWSAFKRRKRWKRNPSAEEVVRWLETTYRKGGRSEFNSIVAFCRGTALTVEKEICLKFLPAYYSDESTSQFLDALASENLISSRDRAGLYVQYYHNNAEMNRSFCRANWQSVIKSTKELNRLQKMIDIEENRCLGCIMQFAKSIGQGEVIFPEFSPENVLGTTCLEREEGNPTCLIRLQSVFKIIFDPQMKMLTKNKFDPDNIELGFFSQAAASSFGESRYFDWRQSFYGILMECYVLTREKRYLEAAFFCERATHWLERIPEPTSEVFDLKLNFIRLGVACKDRCPQK